MGGRRRIGVANVTNNQLFGFVLVAAIIIVAWAIVELLK